MHLKDYYWKKRWKYEHLENNFLYRIEFREEIIDDDDDDDDDDDENDN